MPPFEPQRDSSCNPDREPYQAIIDSWQTTEFCVRIEPDSLQSLGSFSARDIADYQTNTRPESLRATNSAVSRAFEELIAVAMPESNQEDKDRCDNSDFEPKVILKRAEGEAPEIEVISHPTSRLVQERGGDVKSPDTQNIAIGEDFLADAIMLDADLDEPEAQLAWRHIVEALFDQALPLPAINVTIASDTELHITSTWDSAFQG